MPEVKSDRLKTAVAAEKPKLAELTVSSPEFVVFDRRRDFIHDEQQRLCVKIAKSAVAETQQLNVVGRQFKRYASTKLRNFVFARGWPRGPIAA